MVQVIGLGAGGHAKVLIELLHLVGKYKLVGLLDSDRDLWYTDVMGIPVLGGDDLMPGLYAKGIRYAFIGIGTIGDTRPRIRLYDKAKKEGFQIIDVIHPGSILSPSVEFGEGITVMANAVVNSDTKIGKNVIVNSGAVIEHDCLVGNHVHVATGARIAGGVQLYEGVHVGLGASILQGICVGKKAIIGAGSVVINDVKDMEVVVGIPASPIKSEK